MSEETKSNIRKYLYGANIHDISEVRDNLTRQKVVGLVSKSAAADNIRDCVILSSVATAHIFNDRASFIEFEAFDEPLQFLTGTGNVPILGKGIARVEIHDENFKTRLLYVHNAHYQPDFYTNVISSKW